MRDSDKEQRGPPANRPSQVRGRLFRKYVELFLAVVCVALLTTARNSATYLRNSLPRTCDGRFAGGPRCSLSESLMNQPLTSATGIAGKLRPNASTMFRVMISKESQCLIPIPHE